MIGLKRIILAICLVFLLGFGATALEIDEITPGEDFIVYSSAPEKVAEVLNTDPESLALNVAEQNIKFLAVTDDCSKQIQAVETETDFASSVKNLSNLSDSSIKTLLPDITGLPNITGKIISKDGQKYVRINLKNQNEDYILTQFFTVEDGKLYTVSFYTKSGISTDYIENTFKTEESISDNIEVPKTPKAFKIIVIIGTVIFGLACLVLIYSIIKDFVKPKK